MGDEELTNSTRRRAPERRRHWTDERPVVRGRPGAHAPAVSAWGRQSSRVPTSRSRPVPTMPKPRRKTQVRSPGITVAGTLLIIALTVLAFAGGRLFGRVTEPSPTPSVAAFATAGPTPTHDAPAMPTATVPVTPYPLPSTFSRAPIVCLDPGHGGDDRGFARFDANGNLMMEEEPFDLEQAWALKERLEQHSYQVIMTRETDAAVNLDGRDVNGDGRTAAHDRPGSDRNKMIDELQARINICNAAKADLLVSMHINGYSTGTPRGYETWFTRERPFGDRNAAFATLAYAHLKEQFGKIGYVLPAEEERGVLPDTTAEVDKEHALFKHFIMTGPEVPGIITPSTMPGAIVEPLFISNDGDAAVLASPEGENAIVTAYENAIIEYFERYPPEPRTRDLPLATPGRR